MVILIGGATHTGKTVLAQRLLERGVDEATVRNIFWNNALGVMDQCSI